MKLVPDISPINFTLSATIIGYILIDELNANEQNALGNWFMLIGQVLCTNASQQSVQNQRKQNTKDVILTEENGKELMKKAAQAIQSQITK